jgi:hypothetical protein
MLHSDSAYAAASHAALQFMEQRFNEKAVLAPYLAAIEGAATQSTESKP